MPPIAGNQPSNEPQWPPRSPHEALLSTPSGREKLRRLAEQSPSPSRSKPKPSRTAATLAASTDGYDNDEDDDEETLQLKLQEIQARLKLKKLQSAKANAKPTREQQPTAPRLPDGPRQQDNLVEVPVSPIKRKQQSPMRIQPGGGNCRPISLTCASSVRGVYGRDDRSSQQSDTGRNLQRSRTLGTGVLGSNLEPIALPRPLSFNERLASARTEEAVKHERQERIRQLRSDAFGLSKDDIELYKASAVDIPDLPERPRVYSRAEILACVDKTSTSNGRSDAQDGFLKRSSTAPTVRSRLGAGGGTDAGASVGAVPADRQHRPGEDEARDEASFESYSELHLKRRIIPHHALTRAISGKRAYVLKDFLKQVKAPDWSLPDDECDIVLFAILASKSDPRAHKVADKGCGGEEKDKDPPPERGKYMVMTLTDLSFELELFLFNSGFDRFWKLTPGTLIAILNPVIMPPPKGRAATGKFGLVINSDCDTILEVGTARDLGFCQTTRKDGTQCQSWVNARRTEYCEFHSNEALRKVASSRTELGGSAGFGFAGKGARNGSCGGASQREKDRTHQLSTYDRESHSRVFISRGRGAATLLDREGEFASSVERKAALQRRLVQREKENELTRKLGEVGAGAGRDYMQQQQRRHKTGSSASSSSVAAGASSSAVPSTSASTIHSAAVLDLLTRAKSASLVDLGPVTKRKRPNSSTSNSTAVSGGGSVLAGGGGGKPGALGWGSVLKDKLGRMKEGGGGSSSRRPPDQPPITDSLYRSATGTAATSGDRSPVRKKTRFLTEKGIREAGRESLGTELTSAAAVSAAAAAATTSTRRPRRVVLSSTHNEDDDDELIIV